MNIIKSGDKYRVQYVSKNFTTGLTDVTANLIAPNKVVIPIAWHGTDPNSGFCELGQGIYYYDWTVATSTGMWSFEVTSASLPAKAAVAIQVIDGDTLNDTPFEAMNTKVINIETITNNLPDSGALTSLAQDATVAKEATLGTPAGTIASDIAAVDSTVSAIQTAISGISNSTKNTWIGPSSVVIPDTSIIQKRIWMTVFNGDGQMEDPNSNQIRMQIFDSTGTEISETAIPSSNYPSPDYMTRTSTGDYTALFQVTSTGIEEQWSFKHTYVEGSDTIIRYATVAIVSALPSDISSRFDSVDSAIADVKTDTETIITNQGDLVDSTLPAIQETITDAIASLDNVVDAGFLAGAKDATVAKEATLGVPTDTNIATDIANVQAAVDLISSGVGGYMI